VSSAFALKLGGPLYIEVSDSEQTGTVPMIVADPAQFVPRGTPLNMDLETFCLLLAGVREIEPVPGDLPPTSGVATVSEGGLIGKGAIPWRRLLAAMQGLGDELEREARFPRGVAFVLENETRLGGLLRRLREARDARRLLDADYAYALHELLRVLGFARASFADEPESQALVEARSTELRRELDDLTRGFSGSLKRQLQILKEEVPK
jgi:hypothetical protein